LSYGLFLMVIFFAGAAEDESSNIVKEELWLRRQARERKWNLQCGQIATLAWT